MKRQTRWTWLIVVALAAALSLAACSSGDDKTDGDVDGDQETVIDGDVIIDGDEPTDGDEPADGDDAVCSLGGEGLCFVISAGDLAGTYEYVKHDALPSGCFLDAKGYSVQFFDSAAGWSTFTILIEDYSETGDYSNAANDISVQWSIQIGEGDSVDYLNYLSASPCNITVTSETEGSFACKLFDNNNADVTFNLEGLWRCN
jgi:hypothetical protein